MVLVAYQTPTNLERHMEPMSDPNPASPLTAILSELRDTNKEKRRLAVMKLAMHGGEEAVRQLIRIIDNDYEDLIVRGRAALMLGKLGDDRAVMPLIRALNAPGFQIPLNAAEALGHLGDTRAIPPLMNVLENSKDKLRDTALTALKRLGHAPDKDATPAEKAHLEPEL